MVKVPKTLSLSAELAERLGECDNQSEVVEEELRDRFEMEPLDEE